MNVAAALVLAVAALAQDGPSCCQKPLEVLPRSPQRKALCAGLLWSNAQAGRCVPDAGQKIRCVDDAFETLATVREYALSWDDKRKECVMTTTGKLGTVQVPACDGNSC